MTLLKKIRLPILACCCLSGAFGWSVAQAQWSTDPAANLIVSDIAGGNTQPKMVPAPDGGFFVAWFDNIGAGFDVHLQRLDAGGNELWPHDGILVADRGYSFTYDYGLAADTAGNAYVTFNCCANGGAGEHIAVNKVLGNGSLAWGTDGIDVSTAAESVYNAYVTVASDGNIVVAWSSAGGVRAQKLDADGAILWAADGVLLDQPAGVKLLGGVQPGANGDAIVSWSNQSGSTRILRAQKLASADGAPAWGGGSAVRVFGQGNLQAGYYPPFLADGSGGGVFWDYDFSGGSFTARVQHLDAGGNPLLDPNGVVGTSDTTQDHTDTSAIFDAASGSIYLVWRDNFTLNQQTYDGVSAQRIDTTGARTWGDTGKVLVVPANSTDGSQSISQMVALRSPAGFLASWVTGAIPRADQPVSVAALDATGNFAWPSQTVDIKTLRYTGRNVGAVSTNGFAAYAWQDGDDGAGTSTIRAQNINFDGTLGVSDVIFRDGFDGP